MADQITRFNQELSLKRFQEAAQIIGRPIAAEFSIRLAGVPEEDWTRIKAMSPGKLASRFALLTGTRRQQVEGVQIFIPVRDEDDFESPEDHWRGFVDSATPEERAKMLTRTGLAVTEMSPGTLRALVGPGPSSSLLRAMLSQPEKSTAGLMVAPIIEYSIDGAIRLAHFPGRDASTLNRSTELVRTADWTTHIPEAELEPAAPGLVSFGEGMRLPLYSLATRGRRALGVSLNYDERLSMSDVFVSGSMSREGFLAVFKKVATATPPTSAEVTARRTSEQSLAKELFSEDPNAAEWIGPLPTGTSKEDFFSNRRLSMEQFLTLEPGLREWASKQGIPMDAMVTLGVLPCLRLEAPGSSPGPGNMPGRIPVHFSHITYVKLVP